MTKRRAARMLVEYVNLPVYGKATITESEWSKLVTDYKALKGRLPKAKGAKADAWDKAFSVFRRKWEGPNCFWILDSPAQTIAALRAIWSGKLEDQAIVTEISQRLRLGERQPWEWAMLHPESSLDAPPIHVNLDAGTVVLLPSTVDEALWIALLQNYKKLAVCENQTCQHPYFLRYRPSQRYCSEKCALPSQREFKKRWWNEHGKQRRAKQTA
jgi:hypothetical protein